LKPVRLNSVVAASSPSTTSVELVPAGSFKIGPKYELEIIGADLVDAEGRALDGTDFGEPGGNFVATFGRSGATFALPSARLSSAPPSPAAVDAVLPDISRLGMPREIRQIVKRNLVS
jgi:hypothetical protein